MTQSGKNEINASGGEADDGSARSLDDLARAMTTLNTDDEFCRFLTDLCTPAELRALSERWHVARLLDDTELSYRDINARTGVSTTTIGRVARFLRDEPHQGYRTALGRTKNKLL